MAAWTDEEKQEVIKAYEAANPTPENTSEIIEEIAKKVGKTVNGVRIQLSRAEVYVKKVPAEKSATTASGDKPKRVSKADAIAELKSAITDAGQEISDEILDKMTGKAAQYFSGVIRAMSIGEAEVIKVEDPEFK